MTNQTNARRTNARILLGSLAALGLSGLWAPSAFAVTYTIVPGVSQLDWNTSANWTSSGGTFPGAAANDTALVSGAFGGVSQTVDLSAPLVNSVLNLTLGDTTGTGTTTIKTSNATSLPLASGANITSNGLAGAINTISAPVTLFGGLNFLTSTNPISITGKITPSAAAARTIENASGQTVTLGAIDLSAGSTASAVLIRNSNNFTTNHLVLAGTIADGSSVASSLTIGSRNAGGSIRIDGTNTYTGTTTLGVQGVSSLYLINSDQPFGPAAGGTLTIGGPSNAINVLEATGGDRTISKNTMVINRNISFQGANNLTLASTSLTLGNTPLFTNNITTAGKAVTLGSTGGSVFLNNNNVDKFRLRDFTGVGTTLIASNIVENSGAAPDAESKMVVQMTGTGKLILTGTNTFQGGMRIAGTGTVQLGNGGLTGALNSGNSLTPVVNGSAAGTLAFNRSDAVTTPLTVNGPLAITQRGAGTVTLGNSQFNTGSNTIGDGVSPSKLVVTGSYLAARPTTTNANIVSVAPGGSTLTYRTVTLAGGDTVAGLNIKVGQPVYLTSGGASAGSYVDAILSPTQVSIFGPTLLAAGSAALTFGEGSALGTAAATTTVNSLSTLAGNGVIAGAVNALAGSHLSPGVNVGEAATLGTGALTLTGSTLDFDLASTVAGTSDLIFTGSSGLTFGSLSFSFNALTPGTLETGALYHLVSGVGAFSGDTSLISTSFDPSLLGLYTPIYSINNILGTNSLDVAFTAAVPEPSTFALIAGLATLGGCLSRRRRQA